jgi:hypothetical protein
MLSTESEAGSTNDRRYCPFSIKRIAIVRPAWISSGSIRAAGPPSSSQRRWVEKKKSEVVNCPVVLAALKRSGVGH